MENGQINWNDETLVKYGNNWFYVKNGHVDWSYSGDCRYDGTFYRVESGVMTGVNEGKIWKYDTRYAYKNNNVPSTWADDSRIMNEEEDAAFNGKNEDAARYFVAAGYMSQPYFNSIYK